MVALRVYRAGNVGIDTRNRSCLVLQLQSVVYLDQWMKLDDQWVLMVLKSPAGEICHQCSSVVTAIIPYLCTIKLQYTLLGDYWECVRPARLPVLTEFWAPSLREQYTIYVPHWVQAGYNTSNKSVPILGSQPSSPTLPKDDQKRQNCDIQQQSEHCHVPLTPFLSSPLNISAAADPSYYRIFLNLINTWV